jgi:hypothetical protein
MPISVSDVWPNSSMTFVQRPARRMREIAPPGTGREDSKIARQPGFLVSNLNEF